MTAPVRFVLILIGLVAAAAAVMAPRRDEWLAMMRDEDKQAQVIAVLEPRLAGGENDPRLLATLGRSYAEVGNYQRAAELLERYIALRPDDGEAYASLADLDKKLDDMTGRMAMLEHNVSIVPSLSRAVELAGLYRKSGQADKEIALLSRFEAELTVDSGMVLRLAALRAETGDRQGAIDLLGRSERVSLTRQPARNAETRLLLAELLVKSGRSAEAVRLGKQWIVQWHEPWLANRLLNSVVANAPVADADELADAVAVLHPDVRFFLVRGLAAMGAAPVARHLLETWPQANRSPSMNEIAAFLTACRDQNEPDVVWQAFAGVLRGPSAADLIVRYSEAIAAEFGIGALAPFWSSLPKVVIEQKSLLAAQLTFHEHDLAMTMQLLDRVDLAALAAADQLMWLDLLTAVTSPPEAFAMLQQRRRHGRLASSLLPQYARLAGGLGQESEYQEALAQLSSKVD